MVVFPAFISNKRRKLCFVINVLNNKTVIVRNLAEYRLILANSAYGLETRVRVRPRVRVRVRIRIQKVS